MRAFTLSVIARECSDLSRHCEEREARRGNPYLNWKYSLDCRVGPLDLLAMTKKGTFVRNDNREECFA